MVRQRVDSVTGKGRQFCDQQRRASRIDGLNRLQTRCGVIEALGERFSRSRARPR